MVEFEPAAGAPVEPVAKKGNVLGINFSVDLLRPVLASETVLIEWSVSSIATRPRGGSIIELQGCMKGSDERTRVLAHGTVLLTSGA